MTPAPTNPSAALCRRLSEASEACDFAARAIESAEEDGSTLDVPDALEALYEVEAAIVEGRVRLLEIARGDP